MPEFFFERMGYGWGVVMIIFMFLFWIAIFVAIYYLVRYLVRRGEMDGKRSPVDILNERYAKGEINKDEYEKMKKDISK